MSTLTDEIKAFIVMGLARYDTPSQVAEAVGVNFGVAVNRRQVHAYDPACSKPPAQRWCDLHTATRQAFLREVSDIGVAHKAFRLRLLDRMTQGALANHYPVLAAAYLEQAAKECGGFYDRQKTSGPADRSIPLLSGVGEEDTARPAVTSPNRSALENPSAAAPAAR